MQHLEGTFKGVRNAAIYYQAWLPDGEVKAVILLVHGLGEHSTRATRTTSTTLYRGATPSARWTAWATASRTASGKSSSASATTPTRWGFSAAWSEKWQPGSRSSSSVTAWAG
ncbi:MAG: hypothetical protein R2854_06430 [Caldilineaceae bacterium]